MRYVVHDFETASRCNLLKTGAWRYAADFSTFILCYGYKLVVDGKPRPTRVLTEKELTKGDPELLQLLRDPEVIFMAHNNGFEAAIWKYHMEPMGYPPLPPERCHDTMAAAAMRSLPLGLDALTEALERPVRKDMEGHRLMMSMCKPDRHGGWSHHTDFNLMRLRQYNQVDVDSQWGCYLATKGLGPSERKVWIADQKINQRGIQIDRNFVECCMDVLEQVKRPMVERFLELTGGIRPTQRAKILDWVNEQGVPLDNMRKETLNALLDPDDDMEIDAFSDPLPPHVHEVLDLRRALASSSVAKLQRMLDCMEPDGRVRYAMQYHGTRTGRWAGRLIQIQNYPRGEISERPKVTPESLSEAILTRDAGQVKALWGPDVFSAVISSLRSCIVPRKGHILCGGDYSQIEAKNLLSMAGQHDKAKMIHDGMDAYAEMASMIFKKPINKTDNPAERQIGKNCVLGNGYGLGYIGFHARFLKNGNLELAQQAVQAYRTEFAPLVPQFWYKLFEASTNAIWDGMGRTYEFQGIEFFVRDDFMHMRLPSGRIIYYHRPRKETSINPYTDSEHPSWSFMHYSGKKFRRHMAWHGQITADCIQGLSRDLMAHAILKSEEEGFPVIFTVHDELVWEVPDNGSDYAAIQKDLMEDVPQWAHQYKLLVKAECETMERYKK